MADSRNAPIRRAPPDYGASSRRPPRTVSPVQRPAAGRDISYTDLLKDVLTSDARTNRAVKLVRAVTAALVVLLVVLLAMVATVAWLVGPAAAAITGGVPLGATALGTAVGAARTHLRRSHRSR